MNSTSSGGLNYSLIVVLLFTAMSWLGLYALWANFAAQGVELIRQGGLLSVVEGSALVALHAFGALLVLGSCAGVIAVAIRAHHGNENGDHHPHQA